VRIHYGYPQITHRWRKNEGKIEAVKKNFPGSRDPGQVSNKVVPNRVGQAGPGQYIRFTGTIAKNMELMGL
jgi:hypothetical protein